MNELNNCNVDRMVDKFSIFMKDAIDECVPILRPKGKRQFPKWMTYKVKCLRNSKQKMWKKYKMSGSSNDYAEYKCIRNKTTQA